MCREAKALDQELGRHRLYLRLLAGRYLDRRVWPQIDPSDVVQETLLQAFEKQEQFRGPNLLAWLRGILWHRLLTAIRKEKQKAREQQMLDALDQSSCWINSALAIEHSSPSQQAMKHESLERLAEKLNQLPECEAEVIVLHHFLYRSQAEVAMHLGRSRPAVAGLLHRGLKRLRELLHERE
jgi:RNA polymerase sigma-70 factor (ECF subfamily)